MKRLDILNKRKCVRQRLLDYAASLPAGKRIPTVRELTEEFDCTVNMLQQCTGELVREGVFYHKSRKEGTFLRGKRHYVIGLMLGTGVSCEYVNIPWWLSGFCQTIHEPDIVIRTLQAPKLSDIPDLMRTLGLNSLVVTDIGEENAMKLLECLSPEERRRTIVNIPNFQLSVPDVIRRIPENLIYADQTDWICDYVRSGVRNGCRSFIQICAPNHVSESYIDEIRKHGLPWSDDRVITVKSEIRTRLPRLLRDFKVDAIRCAGGWEDALAAELQKFPGFKPFVFAFGYSWFPEEFRKQYPWVRFHFVHEPLEDFYSRWGKMAGNEAIRIAEGGSPFANCSVSMKCIPQKDQPDENPEPQEEDLERKTRIGTMSVPERHQTNQRRKCL